jgi:hypothetical protein
MIQHIKVVTFIHYVCPLSSTSTLLSIYNNPEPNILHIMFREKFKGEFKRMRGSNTAEIS